MKAMPLYRYHQNPGHGWIEVPILEYTKLGISASKYSYKDDIYVYLEEDCDMSKWFDSHKNLFNSEPNIEQVIHNNDA
jgi:hypothetical protein